MFKDLQGHIIHLKQGLAEQIYVKQYLADENAKVSENEFLLIIKPEIFNGSNISYIIEVIFQVLKKKRTLNV